MFTYCIKFDTGEILKVVGDDIKITDGNIIIECGGKIVFTSKMTHVLYSYVEEKDSQDVLKTILEDVYRQHEYTTGCFGC